MLWVGEEILIDFKDVEVGEWILVMFWGELWGDLGFFGEFMFWVGEGILKDFKELEVGE